MKFTTARELRTRLKVDWRPFRFAAAGVVVAILAFLIIVVGPLDLFDGWKVRLGGFLMALIPLFMFAAPGVLLVRHRPSPDVLFPGLDPSFRHPRLVGVAMVWTGTALAGLMAGLQFLPGSNFDPETSALAITMVVGIAISLVTFIPLALLHIFDKTRQPQDL